MFNVYYEITGEFNCRESFDSLSTAIAFAEARLMQGCWDSITVYDADGVNRWHF